MESGFPFGMDYASFSANEHGFDFTPISGSRVQPASSHADPPVFFRGAAGSSNPVNQPQPGVQAVHHEDLPMIDDEMAEVPPAAAEPPAYPIDQDARNSRRGMYTQLDWEAHKPYIQKMYFENKTLKQIKDTMLKDHSFNAS